MDDSTLADVRDVARTRPARVARNAGMVLLALFVLAGAAGVFGVRTSTASATGGGYRLTVEYPQVARAGLDTLWRVTVHRDGGFDGPVTLATSAGYWEMFEMQGFFPSPAEETADPERVFHTFTEPAGDTFVVTFDAYVQPASQLGRTATTSVVVAGADVVSVQYRTWLAP